MTIPKPSPPLGKWRNQLYRAANGRMTTPNGRQAEINAQTEALPRNERDNDNDSRDE